MAISRLGQKNETPSDMNRTIGGLNRVLIKGFSTVRAISTEFFSRTFSLHEGIFDEVDPLSKRLSNETKLNLYKRSQRSLFENGKKNLTNTAPTNEEMKKSLGRVNLTLIDVASGTRAFVRVFFKRISTKFEGFSDGVKQKSSEYTKDMEMKIYDSAKTHQISTKEEPVSKRKVQILNTKESNQSKKVQSYKKTAIVIALLGVIVLLAYYIFPMFQIEMSKVNQALDIKFDTQRGFFIKDDKVHCYDYSFPVVNGERVQNNLKNTGYFRTVKEYSINCNNLMPCECKDKCKSAKTSTFFGGLFKKN